MQINLNWIRLMDGLDQNGNLAVLRQTSPVRPTNGRRADRHPCGIPDGL